ALRGEYDAIVQYNNALAGFEFAKGTLLQHDNIFISEGALPRCAQVRAVEHERERSKALLLRERNSPMVDSACNFEQGKLGVVQVPGNIAPPLPTVMETAGPVPTIKERTPEMDYLRSA